LDEIRWGKALLNGLLAWFLGFVLYMIPSFVYGTWLGFRLGREAQDPSALGRQISEQIASVYAENWVITALLIVVIVLLVLWRARVVAKGTGQRRWVNGLIVGAVPAALSLLFVACGGFGWLDVISMAIYLAAGAIGGLLAPEA
jgi:putative membrane protein (TIGR04086 family)